MGRQWWLVPGAFVACIGILHADERDDLNRAKSEYDSLRSRQDTSKSKLDSYLESSVRLRAFDKDQLAELVTQICKLDIAGNNHEALRMATDLRDRSIDRVRRNYDATVASGSDVFDQLGRLESDTKQLLGRTRDLESKEAVKDDARKLREDVEKLIDGTTRLFEKSTLTATHSTASKRES